MRDRFAGNLSDFLKFAFLRALVGCDRTLGVAWYYAVDPTASPGSGDLEWRNESAWQRFDPIVHGGLMGLSEHSVAALERADIWPKGTLFHREPMSARPQRDTWVIGMRVSLKGANIVFLDPDVGLGAEDKKHATLTELRDLRRPGRAVVFITFPGKNMEYDARLRQLHEQTIEEARAESVLTLRITVSVPLASDPRHYVQRQRWFTLVDPDDELIARANKLAVDLRHIPRVRVRVDFSP